MSANLCGRACFFAAHILSAVDPVSGQPLSDRRVMAEVAAFMGAGFETTSHTITWALTLLVSIGSRQQAPSVIPLSDWPFTVGPHAAVECRH